MNKLFSYAHNGTLTMVDILGTTDYKLSWHQQARILFQNDENVITTEKAQTFIESCATFYKL